MSVGFDLNINTASGVQAIKSLTKVAEELSETFSRFTTKFADLKSTIKPIESVSTSINRLGSGFKNLANYTDSAIAAIELFGEELGKKDSNFKQAFLEIAKLSEISSGVTPGFQVMTTHIRRFGEGLRTTARYADEFKNQIKGVKVIDGQEFNVTKLQTSIKDLYKSLGKINPTEVNQFDAISISLNRLGSSFKKLSGMSDFSALLSKNAVALRETIDQFGSLAAFSPAVVSGFTSIARAISGFTSSLMRVDKVGSNLENLGRALSAIVNHTRSFINQVDVMINANMRAFVRFERLANAIYKASEGLKYFKLASGQATTAADQLNNALQRATRSTNWLAGGWKTVVTAFAGGTVIYTIVNFIKDAIKSFGEFDFQLRQINTIARQSESGLRDIGNAILEVSSRYGKSADDVAKAMFAITTATIEGAGAIEVLTQSAKLAVAGNTDLEGSAQLLSRIIKAYGKSTYEASHLVDVLYMTQERGITTIRELNADLGKVIGTAAAASVSFEELNAAIATLTTRGLKTNIATTALNSLILKLSSDTEKLNPIFQRLGYESTSVALKQLGLAGVMQQLQQATGGTSSNLIKLGFNFRDIRAATILANDVGGQYATNLMLISNESEVAGKATKALGEVQKSLLQQLNQVVETIRKNIVAVTEFVATYSGFKIVLRVINWFTQLKSNGESLIGMFKPLLGGIVQVIAASFTIITTLILLVGAITKVKVGLLFLKRAFLQASPSDFAKNTNILILGIKRLGRAVRSTITDFLALRRAMIQSVSVGRTTTGVFALLRNSVLTLRAAFKVLWKSVLGPFALALVAFEALEFAWNKISSSITNSRANKYLEQTASYVDNLTSSFDKLFTQSAINVRIEKIEEELERLNNLPDSKEARKRIVELAKAVERLNNMKLNLGMMNQDQLNALSKFNEELDKVFSKKLGDFGKFAFLKTTIDKLSISLQSMEKGSTKWLTTMTDLVKNQSEYNNLLEKFNAIADKSAKALLSLRGGSKDNFTDVNNLELAEENYKKILNSIGTMRKMLPSIGGELNSILGTYLNQGALQEAANGGAKTASEFTRSFQETMQKIGVKFKNSINSQLISDLQTSTSSIVGFDKYFKTERTQEELVGLGNSINKIRNSLNNFNSIGKTTTKEALMNMIELRREMISQYKTILASAKLPTIQLDELSNGIAIVDKALIKFNNNYLNYLKTRSSAAFEGMKSALADYAKEVGRTDVIPAIKDMVALNDVLKVMDVINKKSDAASQSIVNLVRNLGSSNIDVFSAKLNTADFNEFNKNLNDFFINNIEWLKLLKKLKQESTDFAYSIGEAVQNAFGSQSTSTMDTFLKSFDILSSKFNQLPKNVQNSIKDISSAMRIGASDIADILTRNLLNSVKSPELRNSIVQVLTILKNETINVFASIKQAREDLLDFRASNLGDAAQLKRLQQKYAKVMQSLQDTTDVKFGLQMSKEAQSLLSQINSLQESMHGGTVTITTVEQMELGSKEAFDILAKAASNDYQKTINANVTNIFKETNKISRELDRIEKNTRNTTNAALSVQTPNGVVSTT